LGTRKYAIALIRYTQSQNIGHQIIKSLLEQENMLYPSSGTLNVKIIGHQIIKTLCEQESMLLPSSGTLRVKRFGHQIIESLLEQENMS
jgi:hypothetical protein